MAFLYDNLIATVVSMTVILVLISIQMRATNANVAQTARNSALNQAQSLATWLEQDLEAMGRNRSDGETVFTNISRDDNTSSPTGRVLRSLTFYYDESDSTEATVEYEIRESGTRMVDGKERTLYELSRRKNGNPDGGSAATLGYFDLQFVNRNAGRVSNPSVNEEEIRGVRVHFSVVAPYQNDESTLHEVHRMVVVPYAPAL